MAGGTSDVGEGDAHSARRASLMDIHVGSRVRMRRMLLGMSQEKLGESLGLTFQQVQKYEKGVNRIGASRLFELSRVLNVSVQFFFEDAPAGAVTLNMAPGFAEQSGESVVFNFLSSRDGMDLNKAFVRIADAKVRRAIVDLVRSLAGDATETSATEWTGVPDGRDSKLPSP